MPERRTLSEQEYNAVRDKVLASLPPNLTEAEFNRLIGQAMDGAIAEAEYSAEPIEGSALGRLASNLGEMVNPVAIAKGVYQAVRHPVQTAENIGSASAEQARKGAAAAREGRSIEALGHFGGAFPVLGPAAAQAGEQIAAGDVAGGIGQGLGMLLPAAAPSIVRGARNAARVLPDRAAAAAEAGAASRVAGVMAPKVGPNKTRFGNMADDVAPSIADDLAREGAPWTREGLHARVSSKLADAEQALDAASDARLAARTFPTQPMIDALLKKRRELTAEAVEGTRPVPSLHGPGGRPTPAGPTRNVSTGRMQPAPTKQGRPIGEDVVPGPNAARVAAIDQAIDELRQLGPVTRYEPIRRIRQAYDGPAKAVYNPSVTADFLKAQGGKLGAADVTGVLRETLARWDPQTATANAQYSLYRRANDVLDAAAEVERTRPRVGRQIIARLTGATAGAQAAGAAGAVTGYVLAPIVESAAALGVTTQLKTAAMMQRLATAIRNGDVGAVTSITSQIKRIGATSAAVVGSPTSPIGPRTQTTAATP